MVIVINRNELNIFANPSQLFKAAADDFYYRTRDLVKKKKFIRVALSGGNTPKNFFNALVANNHYCKTIPWERIQFFFSDERYVPLTDSKSNHEAALQHLFSKVCIPADNIFPVPTYYSDPRDAAIDYANTLRRVFSSNELPSFDLCYLGLGSDGHTASLMPDSEVVNEYCAKNDNGFVEDPLVLSLWFASQNMYRITFTPPLINNSKHITFLVEGSDKASAVKQVLTGARQPEKYPAQLIHPSRGKISWFLDNSAAADILKDAGHEHPYTLGIDIGGTALKMMVIDANKKPISKYLLQLTPQPATRQAVFNVLRRMINTLNQSFDRVAAGFPGVIKQGEIKTAVNMDPSWLNINLEHKLEQLTGKPARVANDAAVQGYGDIKGQGVELVITLGTGVGSALFIDGKLVPNLEFGHHPFRDNLTYEQALGKKALQELGVENWNQNLERAIKIWQRVFNYDHLYLGGGNAKKVSLKLPSSVTLSRNIEGVLGGVALWQAKG